VEVLGAVTGDFPAMVMQKLEFFPGQEVGPCGFSRLCPSMLGFAHVVGDDEKGGVYTFLLEYGESQGQVILIAVVEGQAGHLGGATGPSLSQRDDGKPPMPQESHMKSKMGGRHKHPAVSSVHGGSSHAVVVENQKGRRGSHNRCHNLATMGIPLRPCGQQKNPPNFV